MNSFPECYTNSVALGFGEGRLNYKIENGSGKWSFEATFENNPNDDLPEDSWTGFLKNREGTVSTRNNVFPFDIEQQKKILTVGACLTCHEENSVVMKASLNNFEELVNKRSSKCILPVWE